MSRVARWFLFKPKIPIWVYFGGPSEMENCVIYSGHLEYFATIGYILWAFGNFVVILYIFPHFGILYK
jgi:hypothetical protein